MFHHGLSPSGEKLRPSIQEFGLLKNVDKSLIRKDLAASKLLAFERERGYFIATYHSGRENGSHSHEKNVPTNRSPLTRPLRFHSCVALAGFGERIVTKCPGRSTFVVRGQRRQRQLG